MGEVMAVWPPNRVKMAFNPILSWPAHFHAAGLHCLLLFLYCSSCCTRAVSEQCLGAGDACPSGVL